MLFYALTKYMSQSPRVTIVVLNWNGRSFLPACLTALHQLAYPNYHIVLVDNASTDSSVSYVRQQFSAVQLITSPTNLGFAGGNNLALRGLQSEFAVLVNPDVIVQPSWLDHLLAPMLADPTIGIAGCKLYYPEGKLIQHGGGYIRPPQAMPGHYGILEEDNGQCDVLRDVDYVIGASLAVRQQLFQKVGLLDEGFFLYFEETDWCFRARQAGFRVVYVPEAVGIHLEAATTIKNSASYFHQFHVSRWRFLFKHGTEQMLTTETITAELEWFSKVPLVEQEAALAAYRLTQIQLPSILETRTQDGGAALSLSTARAILRPLIKTAEQATTPKSWLHQAWNRVRNRPFLPLLTKNRV